MNLLIKVFEISDVSSLWIPNIGACRGVWIRHTKVLGVESEASGPHDILKTSRSTIIPEASVIIIYSLTFFKVHILRRFSIVLNRRCLNVHLLILFWLLLVNLVRKYNAVNLGDLWVALGIVSHLILLLLDSESVNDWPLCLSTRCPGFSRYSRMDDISFLGLHGYILVVLSHHIQFGVLLSAYASASPLIHESVFLLLIYWVCGVTSRLSDIREKICLLKDWVTNIWIKRWFLCRQK